MKILITGGTGFVGSNILQKLEGYDYRIIVRDKISNYPLSKQIIYRKDLFEVFKKEIKLYSPDIVVHLASYLTSADDTYSIAKVVDSNILFTSILLESLKETNIKLFINTGTFAEYYYNDGKEDPAYYYAASKLAVRPIIQYFKNLIGFKTINIIPYTIYGGKSKSKKVIDYIIDSVKSAEPIEMTSGEQILDFIHIDDVVDFFIHCIENIELLNDTENYHLGTGIGTSIKQLSNIIEDEMKVKTSITWGIKDYRPLDIMKAIAPIYKLEKELNWKPKVSIKDGIKEIIEEER